jgi:hypothetical protein
MSPLCENARRRVPIAPRGVALAVLLGFAGCVPPLENAILEVELVLPPNTLVAESTHAVVEVAAGEVDFYELWPRDGEPDGVPLPREPSATSISVVSGSAIDAISMKVRFCQDPQCALPGSDRSPEAHLLVRRPFHLGERSAIRVEVPAIPLVFERLPDVEGCAVRACTEELRDTYCDAAGAHLCDLR